MPKQSKTEQLMSLAGVGVTVENRAHQDPGESDTLHFNLHGTLERPTEDDLWLVRVKECYEGSSTISFKAEQVTSIDRMPSGRWIITLR